VLGVGDLAALFGGFRVPVPRRLVTGAALPTWRLGLQPMHPGWLTLADQAPLVDTSRARAHLGWQPRHDAQEALAELSAGMRAWPTRRRWSTPAAPAPIWAGNPVTTRRKRLPSCPPGCVRAAGPGADRSRRALRKAGGSGWLG